jgi:hypothetical protein
MERIVYGIGGRLCGWAERGRGDRAAMVYWQGTLRYGLGVKITKDKAYNDRAIKALYRSLRDLMYDKGVLESRATHEHQGGGVSDERLGPSAVAGLPGPVGASCPEAAAILLSSLATIPERVT